MDYVNKAVNELRTKHVILLVIIRNGRRRNRTSAMTSWACYPKVNLAMSFATSCNP